MRVFLILFILYAQIPYLYGYGERIGLPEGTAVTGDFVDRDGDRVDDRYQKGPGLPAISNEYIGLPRVEYYGNVRRQGVADLRYGVRLYQEWLNLLANRPSKLMSDPLPIAYEDEKFRQVTSGKADIIKFIFPMGIEVYASEDGSYILFSSGDTVIPILFYLKEGRISLKS